MSEYEFKGLSTPIRLTEDFLRSEAVKMNMEPSEYLEKLRREWPVEIEEHHEKGLLNLICDVFDMRPSQASAWIVFISQNPDGPPR